MGIQILVYIIILYSFIYNLLYYYCYYDSNVWYMYDLLK